MSALKRVIQYLLARYWFIAGLIAFCLAFIYCNFLSIDRQIEAPLEVIGVISTYPKYEAEAQQILIKETTGSDILLVKIPRSINVSKGDTVSCHADKVLKTDKTYLKARGVVAEIYNCQSLQIINRASGLQSWLNDIRANIDAFCREHIPEPGSSLLIGMLIGSDESFTADFDNALLFSGLRHIIAVSGFNVGFVSNLFMNLAPFIGRKKCIVLVQPILIGYLLLVGPENIPAFRATIMNSYILFGQAVGVRPDFLNSIGVAILLILLVNPFAVMSVSLYLSLFAVLGQNIISPYIKRFIKSESVALSLSCILGALPVTLFVFKKIYPWALLFNVIIAPFLPIIMEISIISLILHQIIIPFWGVILLPLNGLMRFCTDIISYGDALPMAVVDVNVLNVAILIIIIAVLYLIIKQLRLKLSYENLD